MQRLTGARPAGSERIRSRWVKWARLLLPYAIGLALIVLLLRQIDPLQVLRLLIGIDLRWLLVGFGLYVACNLVRAYRFDVLLRLREHAIPRAEMHPWLVPLKIIPDVFALSLFNNILPSRSGDLSFPYLMHERHGMGVGESTAALVVVRIFDYVTVALLYLFFVTANLSQLSTNAKVAATVVAFFLLLTLVILAAIPWLSGVGLRFAEWLFRRLSVSHLLLSQRLLSAGERAVSTLERVRTPETYARIFGYSLLSWLGTFAWFAAFMQAIGLPTPFPILIVGATFAVAAKALPISFVGGFGAHEAGWTLGFSLIGMETGQAIASGFAVDILTLVASMVFGAAAVAYMLLARKRQLAEER